MNALISPLQIDKSQVEKQFSRAAFGYDSAASVQQAMSEQLISLARPYLEAKAVRRITDLGCGTGLSLQQFAQHYPTAELTGVDLSAAMLEQAKIHASSANLICADMEEHLTEKPQDLIFSNASMQWCSLEKVLRQAYQSLHQGGFFAFSSFGPHTHIELAKAWQTLDDSDHRIDFLSLSEMTERITESGFTLLEQQRDLRQLEFDTAKDLLSSIKKTGATNAAHDRARGLMSKERYQLFLSALDQQHPLKLSYEALSFVLQKGVDPKP